MALFRGSSSGSGSGRRSSSSAHARSSVDLRDACGSRGLRSRIPVALVEAKALGHGVPERCPGDTRIARRRRSAHEVALFTEFSGS